MPWWRRGRHRKGSKGNMGKGGARKVAGMANGSCIGWPRCVTWHHLRRELGVACAAPVGALPSRHVVAHDVSYPILQPCLCCSICRLCILHTHRSTPQNQTRWPLPVSIGDGPEMPLIPLYQSKGCPGVLRQQLKHSSGKAPRCEMAEGGSCPSICLLRRRRTCHSPSILAI